MRNASDIQAAYRLICKKCGSDKVAVDAIESERFDEEVIPGTVTFICHGCEANNVFVRLD